MNGNIILRMNHIRKAFTGVLALDNVNFNLLEGEVHVLLGENGAGKSTLIKILSGAYQKSDGEILLYDQKIEINNPKHSQELGITTIYQELNLVSHLTAAENIYLGREPINRLGFINQKKLFSNAQKILDELNVQISSKSIVNYLGVAQQQMVEVAKALSLNAKILIMDEPTSALTEAEIRKLFITIRRLKNKGVSIIYISHRLEELFEIGDRVTVLRDGKHIGTEEISKISKPLLIRMMVNRELKEQFPKKKAEIGEEILVVENLSIGKTLDNINFKLHRGEILGIAGLMGAGRTELARAIFGVEKIDSGQIYLKDQPVKIKSPKDAINLKIGFLTEDRKSQGLILILSVKENICLPSVERFSKLGIVQSTKESQAATRYKDELQIKTPDLDQKTMFLSGGNQQKVVLSKWLCSEADIFIFDEPTRGIDVGSKVEIYQIMNHLTSQGIAIIMISSELPEILGMSDRILVMRQGRIVDEFLAETVNQEDILRSAIGA